MGVSPTLEAYRSVALRHPHYPHRPCPLE